MLARAADAAPAPASRHPAPAPGGARGCMAKSTLRQALWSSTVGGQIEHDPAHRARGDVASYEPGQPPTESASDTLCLRCHRRRGEVRGRHIVSVNGVTRSSAAAAYACWGWASAARSEAPYTFDALTVDESSSASPTQREDRPRLWYRRPPSICTRPWLGCSCRAKGRSAPGCAALIGIVSQRHRSRRWSWRVGSCRSSRAVLSLPRRARAGGPHPSRSAP